MHHAVAIRSSADQPWLGVADSELAVSRESFLFCFKRGLKICPNVKICEIKTFLVQLNFSIKI